MSSTPGLTRAKRRGTVELGAYHSSLSLPGLSSSPASASAAFLRSAVPLPSRSARETSHALVYLRSDEGDPTKHQTISFDVCSITASTFQTQLKEVLGLNAHLAHNAGLTDGGTTLVGNPAGEVQIRVHSVALKEGKAAVRRSLRMMETPDDGAIYSVEVLPSPPPGKSPHTHRKGGRHANLSSGGTDRGDGGGGGTVASPRQAQHQEVGRKAVDDSGGPALVPETTTITDAPASESGQMRDPVSAEAKEAGDTSPDSTAVAHSNDDDDGEYMNKTRAVVSLPLTAIAEEEAEVKAVTALQGFARGHLARKKHRKHHEHHHRHHHGHHHSKKKAHRPDRSQRAQQVLEQLERMDSNSDGQIDEHELTAGFGSASTARGILAKYDEDGDGMLSKAELSKMRDALSQSPHKVTASGHDAAVRQDEVVVPHHLVDTVASQSPALFTRKHPSGLKNMDTVHTLGELDCYLDVSPASLVVVCFSMDCIGGRRNIRALEQLAYDFTRDNTNATVRRDAGIQFVSVHVHIDDSSRQRMIIAMYQIHTFPSLVFIDRSAASGQHHHVKKYDSVSDARTALRTDYADLLREELEREQAGRAVERCNAERREAERETRAQAELATSGAKKVQAAQAILAIQGQRNADRATQSIDAKAREATSLRRAPDVERARDVPVATPEAAVQKEADEGTATEVGKEAAQPAQAKQAAQAAVTLQAKLWNEAKARAAGDEERKREVEAAEQVKQAAQAAQAAQAEQAAQEAQEAQEALEAQTRA